MKAKKDLRFVVLSGGVGGAKMVDGLHRYLPPGALQIIANTADDFLHWDLHISPDVDTIMYTLAGVSNRKTGWGVENDTFETLKQMSARGQADWFALGDKDLCTHVERTHRLRKGETLTGVTRVLCAELGVSRPILPMTDGNKRTIVHTKEGNLEFQDWLVKRRAGPVVSAITFDGQPPATPEAIDAIQTADILIIAPSNPYVSIDPILKTEPISKLLENKTVVGISPIIGQAAIKGPLGSMIPALSGLPASPSAICRHYGAILDAFVIDRGDEVANDVPLLKTDIVMRTPEDRLRLASEVVTFSARLV